MEFNCWCGFEDCQPVEAITSFLYNKIPPDTRMQIMYLNDNNRMTFLQIADWLEENNLDVDLSKPFWRFNGQVS